MGASTRKLFTDSRLRNAVERAWAIAKLGRLEREEITPPPEAQVRAHLIVAGAAGVELFAHLSHQFNQPPLHSEWSPSHPQFVPPLPP